MRQLQWLLGAILVFVSLGSVLFLEAEDFGLIFLLLGATAASLVWPGLPGRFPAWTHRLAFPAIVAAFAVQLWTTADPLQAFVRLDLALLLYRGFFYRSRREDLQLILLGLFLLVVAGVVTASPAFALQLLLFTACSLVLLFTATIADAADPEARRRKLPLFMPVYAQTKPEWVEDLNWRRLLRRLRAAGDWRLLALAALLFGGLVAVSALLFISIPRFQLENSLFLERLATHRARTGFNDTVTFGEVTEISKDTSVAFSVDVPDPGQLGPTPYFRMLVLDEYLPSGGFRMSAELRRELAAHAYSRAFLRGDAPASVRGHTWTFYLEAGVSRYLPLPGRFRGLRLRDVQDLEVDPSAHIVSLRTDPLSMTAYRIEAPLTAPSLPDWDFARRWRAAPQRRLEGGNGPARLALTLPIDAASRVRLEEWATQIAGAEAGRLTPEGFALRATDWLRARHSYAMDCRIPAGPEDPLVRWIGSTEPGYCELFAGSLVQLCRVAGVPARIVLGFKGGAWNVYSSSFTVRNSEAHAWCEIWDGRSAWLRIDPTPGAVALSGVSPAPVGRQDWGFDRGFGARLNSLRVFWYRRIVNFDLQSQAGIVDAARDTAKAARRQFLGAIDATLRHLKAFVAAQWRQSRAGTVIEAALAFLAAGAMGWAAWRLRRYLSVDAATPEQRVRREAGKWLAQLRAAAAVEDAAPLRRDLERLRFGPASNWPEPSVCFREARRRAKRRTSAGERA